MTAPLVPITPTPFRVAQLPAQLMHVMRDLSNPTPETAAFAPSLLDWGSVIPGRCLAAWKRDWLEFQERLFDEVAVSIFWLYGFQWMEKLFNGIQKSIPGLKHLPTDVGKSLKSGSATKIALKPLERYAKNYQEALLIQSVRGSKTMLSVITNFVIIAVMIPRINQWKTAWILTHVKQRENRSLTNKPVADSTLANKAVHANKAFGQMLKESNEPNHPRFGQRLPAWSPTVLEPFSNLMEVIKSSDYGPILSGDGAMLTGRSYSAFTRPGVSSKDTIGEVREILWRDVASAYLYLWGVPHIAKAATAALKPFWPSETRLEPIVGQYYLQQLKHAVKTEGLTHLNAEALQHLWHGQQPDMVIQHWLSGQLRQTGFHQQFLPQLGLEARTMVSPESWQEWQPRIITFLERHGAGDQLHSQSVEALLEAMEKQEGPFAKLTDKALRHDLTTSIKLAFAHTVGQPADTLLKQLKPQLKPSLSLEAIEKLESRVQRIATQQTQALLASQFRRAVNIWQVHAPEAPKALTQWLALAEQLEQSAVSMEGGNAFSRAFEDLPHYLGQLRQVLEGDAKKLLAQYQQTSVQLLKQPKLGLLENDATQVEQALSALLSDGVRHEPELLHQAARQVGIAQRDYRMEVNPEKLASLQTNLDAFWQHLLQTFDTLHPDGVEAQAAMATLEKLALTRNALPRYAALTVGVVGSMISLGVLVPWLQYWITRKTTGKNEQPALAALRQRYGMSV